MMKTRFYFILSAAFLAAWLLPAGGVGADDGEEAPVPYLTEMAPGLYRGGQPTEEGYRELKDLGIRTIVNFRHESEWIESGRIQSEALGMDYISFPWTIFGPLDLETIRKFLAVAGDPAKRPLYFHCRRGVERTGLMSTLYYIHYEGLDPEKAYNRAFEGFPLKWIWKPFVKSKLDKFQDRVRKS